jgi:CheY-like chemotaxis protein
MNHGSSDCVRAGEAVGRWLGDMDGRGYSVLHVDDEPAVRSMLRRWLAGRDLTVCAEAGTGEQALAAAASCRPAAILLDHGLPDTQARNSSPGYGSFVRLPASCLFTADQAAARAVQATGAAVAVVEGSPLDDLHKGSPRQRTPGRHHEVRRASRQPVGGGDRRLRHAHRG